MRQTFFHELEELEKREKQEKEERERVELYLRKKSGSFRDYLPFVFVILIGAFAAVVTVYALYLFINVSRIGNVADVHLTKVLELAIRSYQGKAYDNPELGIKNWMVFTDKENGFEIRYPENWFYNEHNDHLFEIKKYNSRASINESLAAAGFVLKFENNDKLGLEDFAVRESGVDKAKLVKRKVGERELVKTGKIRREGQLPYSEVFWERDGRIYSFKTIFYNQKSQVSEDEFNKMVLVIDINK